MNTTSMSMLSLVDVIAIVIVLVGIWHGIMHGASPRFATFCGVIIGLVVGLFTYPFLLKVLNPHGTMNITLQHFLALMGSVFGAFIVLAIIRYLIAQMARMSSFVLMDRLGGGLAGLIQTSVIVFLLFIALISVDNKNFVHIFGEQSAIGRQAMRLTHELGMTIGTDYEKTQEKINADYNISPNQRHKPR